MHMYSTIMHTYSTVHVNVYTTCSVCDMPTECFVSVVSASLERYVVFFGLQFEVLVERLAR